jgi:calcineurin-like phosphoesterase
MVGSYNSAIGMSFEPVTRAFLTQMPSKFMPEISEPWILTGVEILCDVATGRAESITRIRRITELVSA